MLNLSTLKHAITGTPAEGQPPRTPNGSAAIEAQVVKKQKELRLGKTEAAVRRLAAELAKARETAAHSQQVFRDCLANEDDTTAAKLTMKQDAGQVTECEMALANAEDMARQAKQELQAATARVQRADLNDAMTQLQTAMQHVEAQFAAAASAADALNAALDGAAAFSSANELLRSKLLDIRAAYKKYVMKAHRAMLPEGKAFLPAIDKPFSAWIPDLDTLPKIGEGS